MVSEAAQAALDRAAKRAARVASADAGLTTLTPDEVPKHPSAAAEKALEIAKEKSRTIPSVVCQYFGIDMCMHVLSTDYI